MRYYIEIFYWNNEDKGNNEDKKYTKITEYKDWSFYFKSDFTILDDV